MSHSHEKGNFWSKVRSSTKNLSTQIGNLSIRAEHDGDTEESTLIHKALVKHYQTHRKGYPEWLGVVEEEKHSHQRQQQAMQQRHQNPYNRHQPQTYRPSQGQDQGQGEGQGQGQGQGQDHSAQAPNGERLKYRRAAASFKDMYINNSSEPQSHGQNDKSSGIRDRLKRNNYRNNFV